MNDGQNNTNREIPGHVIKLNFFNVAAAACGLLALFSILTGVFPLFFGSLSIIFAVLSKGSDLCMSKLAKSSVITSAFSMIMGAIITAFVVYNFVANPDAAKYIDEAFIATYGVTYDEYFEGMEHYSETGEIPEFLLDTNGNLRY